MKWPSVLYSVVAVMAVIPAGSAFAQSSDAVLEKNLKNQILKARQRVRVSAAEQSVARFKLVWKWDNRYTEEYSFRVRNRPGKRIIIPVQKGSVEQKEMQCAGVVLAGSGRVVTHGNCFKAPNNNKEDFRLSELTLFLKNGKTARLPESVVRYSGEFAYINAWPELVKDVPGVQIQAVSGVQTLKDIYGEQLPNALFQFAASQVSKSRASRSSRFRLSDMDSNALVGTPLFYAGRVVALSTADKIGFWAKLKGGTLEMLRVFNSQNGGAALTL